MRDAAPGSGAQLAAGDDSGSARSSSRGWGATGHRRLLLAIAEPLAGRVARADPSPASWPITPGLAAAAESLGRAHGRRSLHADRRAVGRVPTSRVARMLDSWLLAIEQDVDLVLVCSPRRRLLDYHGARATSSVLLAATSPSLIGREPAPGPVLVPFAGTDHDWSAIQLGVWLAGSWQVPLASPGGGRGWPRREPPARERVPRRSARAGRRCRAHSSSRPARRRSLLRLRRPASRAPFGPPAQRDGLGPSRWARGRQAATRRCWCARGLRPGGLAPPENLTHFTWSLKG